MASKVIIIDPNTACGDIMHDSTWRCSDNTTSHICQREASHISKEAGDERLHKCSMCMYMWPDGQVGVAKHQAKHQTIRLCDQCSQPCIKDDFMGIKVWICEECQEIYDARPEKDQKEDKKKTMICPIQAHYKKHEAEGKCSYGYCTAHCDEYHDYMPNHRPDKPKLALVKKDDEPAKPVVPDPQPLQQIETFDRPADVDWRVA